MPKLIKDSSIVNDDWHVIAADSIQDSNDIDQSSNNILPLKDWLAFNEQLDNNKTAVLLLGSDALEALEDKLHSLPLIAIDFAVFTDGRGYSLAQRLRNQYDYQGEIRAIGDVLLDQLFYLQRCGFNSFKLKENAHYDKALAYFNTFSQVYQTSIDAKVSILQQRIAPLN